MEDISSGRIITKIEDRKTDSRGGYTYLNFIITIDCKEKKFRYKITDIKSGAYIQPIDLHIDNILKGYFEATNPDTKKKGEQLDFMFKELGNSIKKEMCIKDDF